MFTAVLGPENICATNHYQYTVQCTVYNVHSVEAAQGYRVLNIDEGFKQKPMQRSSRLFGEQIPCLASCFASVVLEK